jgi:hypothetical protein
MGFFDVLWAGATAPWAKLAGGESQFETKIYEWGEEAIIAQGRLRRAGNIAEGLAGQEVTGGGIYIPGTQPGAYGSGQGYGGAGDMGAPGYLDLSGLNQSLSNALGQLTPSIDIPWWIYAVVIGGVLIIVYIMLK